MTVKYNDHPFRIVLALVAAHTIVLYNDPQNFFEAVFTSSYLRGFIASFIMAYVIISYIYYLNVRLDRVYGWDSKVFSRFFWQNVLGFFVPAILVFIFVTLFLSVYRINILETQYLRQDYPLVLLMILIANLYYFGLYCFLKLRRVNNSYDFELDNGDDLNLVEKEVNLIATSYQNNIPQDLSKFKEVIMVDTATKTIPVAADDIAYAYRLGGAVFIRVKSMQLINESYPVSYTLKDLETMLNPAFFFRINRQMLVHIDCCIAYQSEKNKTLALTLDPVPYPRGITIPKEHAKLHIVSEDRSTKFKMWMDR